MTGAVRIHHHNFQIRPYKGKVIVPSVPEQELGLFLRSFQDRPVIDAGVDDDSLFDQMFILLPLFHCADVLVQIPHRGEALHAHPVQVTVRHRMPDYHGTNRARLKNFPDAFRNPALAAPRPDGTYGDDRDRGPQHRPVRPQKDEVCAQR